MRKILIVTVAVLGILFMAGCVNKLNAAPTSQSSMHIYPFTDSKYDLGTTTKAWRNVVTDQLCLNGTCQSSWSAGSQTPWTSTIDGGGYNLTNVGNVTGATFTATSTSGANLFAGTLTSYGLLTVPYLTSTTTATSSFAGAIGIGTTNPSAKLHVSDGNTLASVLTSTLSTTNIVSTAQSTKAISQIIASNTYTDRGINYFIKSRGTLDTPLVVQNDDYVGDLLFGAYDGSQVQNSAGVFSFVDGVASAGNVPLRLSFVTGSTSFNRLERLTIKNNGNVGIGTSTPSTAYKLSVNGDVMAGLFRSTSTSASIFPYASTTGATIPTLWNTNASSTWISATRFYGAVTGTASLATALAANGANCTVTGQFPLGVDASGAVETCTGVVLASSTSLPILGTLAGLTTIGSTSATTTATGYIAAQAFGIAAKFFVDTTKAIFSVLSTFTQGIIAQVRLNIPNGTAPLVTNTGDIALDTTAGQLVWNDGTGTTTTMGYYTTGFFYSTSTAWTGTTTIYMAPAQDAQTWRTAKCEVNTGTVNVSVYDGTNRMNMFNASSTIGTVVLTTNNSFTSSESIRVDVGTPASSPLSIACRFKYTYDLQ